MPRVRANFIVEAATKLGLEFKRVDVGAGSVGGTGGMKTKLLILRMLVANQGTADQKLDNDVLRLQAVEL